jgi:hypothetical protein
MSCICSSHTPLRRILPHELHLQPEAYDPHLYVDFRPLRDDSPAPDGLQLGGLIQVLDRQITARTGASYIRIFAGK